MKIRLLLLSVALLAAGCVKTPFEEFTNGPEVMLGAISLNSTTRATTSVLPQNYRFRLYVLPAGVKDLSKQVATRTYTITDGAGTPTLDAGQKKLTLAIGSFDTYIVGPLLGVDENGDQTEIANQYRVNCIIGNDIVSSYTPLNIEKTTGNVLNPAPLNHRMAKVEMVVQRPDDAAYTELVVNEISLDAQPISGTFELNTSGISITPTTATAKTRKWVPTPDATASAAGKTKYVAVDYLFPQESKELKISTTFHATISGKTNKYLQSGQLTTDLAVGTQHRFTAEPSTPMELLWRLKLVPWVDSEMSGIEMSEEVVFNFSGEDAPITLNGEQYWPDRSGNERHAKIVRDIIHDAANKCYRLKDGGAEGMMTSYLELPKLGKMTNYTLELVYKATTKSQSIPVNFGASGFDSWRELSINLPYDNEVSSLEGDISIITNRAKVDATFQNDQSVMETMATWAFTRTPEVERKVYRNGVELASVKTAAYDLNFDVRGSNSLFSLVRSGMRLYSARMYRRVLSADQLVKNAENDRIVYTKALTNSDGYVENGMILNLQGDQAPSTTLVSGKTVWPDKSLYQNHAAYTASSSAIIYDYNSKSYKFPATSNDLMKLSKPLGDLTNATIEIVLMAAGNTQNTVFYFADDNIGNNSDNRRIVHMHYPWDKNIDVNFPYINQPGTSRFSKTTSTFAYTDISNIVYQYSMVRDAQSSKTLSFYQNNMLQTSVAAPNVSLNPVVEGYIGGQINQQMYGGYIMALRVYNRPLTEAERRINYEVDKQKYNLIKPITTDILVGNFAGNLVNSTVSNETHYYFNKSLYTTVSDEMSSKWSDRYEQEYGATSRLDGKANTTYLNNKDNAKYQAANKCAQKAPAGMWYLPAIDQLAGMYVAKSALGAIGDYWSSYDNIARGLFWALQLRFSDGYVYTNAGGKGATRDIRCVTEKNTVSVANKVIKDASGNVYIDVQGMPQSVYSTTTLNKITLSGNSGNGVFKKLQIAKNNLSSMSWAQACGLQGTPNYNTQTAVGVVQGLLSSTSCKGYSTEGNAGSWRLPTQREAYLMSIMSPALTQAGISLSGTYWTSSESDATNAWVVDIPGGGGGGSNPKLKTETYNIRCVREVN